MKSNKDLAKVQLIEIMEILEDALYIVSGTDMQEEQIIKNLKTFKKQEMIDGIMSDVRGARETLRRVDRIKNEKK